MLGAILCFGLIVFAHELGHFLSALWNKIPVEEFAMGMGPLLWTQEIKGIRYSLRLFPIGAFVRVVGEEDGTNLHDTEDSSGMDDTEKRAVYYGIPVGRRMAMAAAGPLFNFVLAVLLFFGIGIFSGIANDKPVIGTVSPGSIAESAGLESQDLLLSIDGTSLGSWSEAVYLINAAPEREIVVELDRLGETKALLMTPERSPEDGLGRIGISVEIKRFDLPSSARIGLHNTLDAIGLFYSSIAGAIRTRQAPELVGPVGIIQATGEFASSGLADLLWFMAFISINLGVVNLLPIPPLDGARLLLMGIEKLRGKPMNPEREGMIHMVGYICLIGLIVVVTFGDIWKIIRP